MWDPTWMYTPNKNKTASARKTFRFLKEHDQRGKDGNANNFKTHMKVVQDMNQQGQLSFNDAEVQQNANDPSVVEYRQAWNAKWAIVKDIMCGPDYYDCELLDDIIDFEH